MTNRTPLREQLNKNNRLPKNIIIGIFVLFLFFNIYLLNRMEKVTSMNTNLTAYYDNMKQANFHARDALQNRGTEELTRYNTSHQAAIENISKIKLSSELSYRMEQLLSMTEYYDRLFIETIASDESGFSDSYQRLNQAYEAIMATKSDYYTLLTGESVRLHSDLIIISNVSFFLGSTICFSILFILTRSSNQQADDLLRPIEIIVENLSQIKEGQYEYEYVDSNINELQFLAQRVLEMSLAIQEKEKMEKEHHELFKLYLEEQNKTLQYKEMISQSELKQMENTLNPHFLFNTLNIIYKNSLKENATETSELLETMSQYLRYNLDYSDNTSNLIHEVSAVQDYIKILQARFGSRIQFHVHIDDTLPNIDIPGVIIQPIIENSINYAFKPSHGVGTIDLSITYENDMLSIVISDDGVGMPEEDVDHIRMNNAAHFNRASSLSLYNIMYRLNTHFKDKVSFSINTSQDVGFEVFIEIDTGGLYE